MMGIWVWTLVLPFGFGLVLLLILAQGVVIALPSFFSPLLSLVAWHGGTELFGFADFSEWNCGGKERVHFGFAFKIPSGGEAVERRLCWLRY